MNRRHFLFGTAGTAAASFFGSGCATTGRAGEPLPPPGDVDTHIMRYDRVMQGIRAATANAGFGAEEHRLATGALATLFAAGSYKDLDPSWRREARVQRRLLEAQPIMDDAVFGMTAYLERLDATRRHAVRDRLRRGDGLLDRIVADLVEPGAVLGVSDDRRRHLEELTRHLGGRLIHQPASLVIDDTVSGIRRLERRNGWTPESRALMAAQIQKRLREEPQRSLAEEREDERYADSLILGGAITMGSVRSRWRSCRSAGWSWQRSAAFSCSSGSSSSSWGWRIRTQPG